MHPKLTLHNNQRCVAEIEAFKKPKDVTWEESDQALFAGWEYTNVELQSDEAVCRIRKRKELVDLLDEKFQVHRWNQLEARARPHEAWQKLSETVLQITKSLFARTAGRTRTDDEI